MPLIQCIPGPTETTVNGQNYAFQYDRFGRAIAQVYDAEAVKCFLAVQHYVEVSDTPVAEPTGLAELLSTEPAVVPVTVEPAVSEPEPEPAVVIPPSEYVTTETLTGAEADEEIAPAVVPTAVKKKGGRPSKKSLAGE